MVEFLISMVLLSYRAPRVAMRRVLDMIAGFEGVALIFGVSFTLSALLMLAIAQIGGQGGGDIGYLISNFFFSLIGYLVAVALVFWVGKAFGGRGRFLDVATAIAWHSLVTVIFTPLVAVATMPGIGDGALGLLAVAQIAMIGVILWLMANFVAEAHGFRSALRVALVLIGGLLVIGFVLSLFLAPLLVSVGVES